MLYEWLNYFLFTAFSICWGLQIAWVLMLYRSIQKARKGPKVDGHKPPVTVIIAARNEAHNLKQNLITLLSQDYPDYEVIVVNDRSTDDTPSVLQDHKASSSKLTVVTITEEDKPADISGKKYALYCAVQKAKTEWLLFTDGDCQLDGPNWIRNMAVEMKPETNAILGVSPYRKSTGLLSAVVQYETMLTAFQYLGSAKLGCPYMGVGRNLATTKENWLHFFQHHGQKHLHGGEDDLLVNSITPANSIKICLKEDSFTYSYPENQWKRYVIQRIRHLSISKQYPIKSWFLSGLYTHSQFFLYLFGLLNVYLFGNEIPILIMVLLRTLLLFRIFKRLREYLNCQFSIILYPVLEIIHLILNQSIGLIAYGKRSIRWK
jgi:glycosyltransferase involved in cell wall biosynthesis